MTTNLQKLLSSDRIIIRFLFGIMVVIILFLAFNNLQYNPRFWQDEGAALSLAKGVAQNGVYGMQSSDGYQTFGPIQSVGPTVILPVALIYKIFGVGLLQGRLLAATFLIVTLGIFLIIAIQWFGKWTALIAIFLLISSPAARIIVFGRSVLGEIPALGLTLLGILLVLKGFRSGHWKWHIFGGIFLGLAVVTKTQYVLLVGGAIVYTSGYLFLVNRQKRASILFLVCAGLPAFALYVGWAVWQYRYFGPALYMENARKMQELASNVIGLNYQSTLEAIRYLFGAESQHFYYFWGFPAIVYSGWLSLKRGPVQPGLLFCFSFCVLGIGYYVFYVIPYQSYLVGPAAMTALFVGKLWFDLIDILFKQTKSLNSSSMFQKVSPYFPIGMLLICLMTMVTYTLRISIVSDVLQSYPDTWTVSKYIDDNVGKGCLIETWERELAITTDKTYHFPDQSYLARARPVLVRQTTDFSLGQDYFTTYHPDYVIIGWFAGQSGIYNQDFITKYGQKIISFGEYEIYRLNLPNPAGSNGISNPICP